MPATLEDLDLYSTQNKLDFLEEVWNRSIDSDSTEDKIASSKSSSPFVETQPSFIMRANSPLARLSTNLAASSTSGNLVNIIQSLKSAGPFITHMPRYGYWLQFSNALIELNKSTHKSSWQRMAWTSLSMKIPQVSFPNQSLVFTALSKLPWFKPKSGPKITWSFSPQSELFLSLIKRQTHIKEKDDEMLEAISELLSYNEDSTDDSFQSFIFHKLEELLDEFGISAIEHLMKKISSQYADNSVSCDLLSALGRLKNESIAEPRKIFLENCLISSSPYLRLGAIYAYAWGEVHCDLKKLRDLNEKEKVEIIKCNVNSLFQRLKNAKVSS